ncbi:MAG: hypothetical protein J4469_01590 [Candidatus Aenigmarchaeota archaeon]|nr:hypothetical protein [Candidatus Aenigmarchaeota archaeon]HLD39448.1 hypothetical protein [archaeon]
MENPDLRLFSLAFKPGSFIELKRLVEDTVEYDILKDSHPRLTDIGFYSIACVGEVVRLHTYWKMAVTTYNALF